MSKIVESDIAFKEQLAESGRQKKKEIIVPRVKHGSHIIVMTFTVPVVVSRVELDYDTCVLSQVPQAEFNLASGTVGTVQSDLRKIKSQSYESLMK